MFFKGICFYDFFVLFDGLEPEGFDSLFKGAVCVSVFFGVVSFFRLVCVKLENLFLLVWWQRV